MVKFYKHNKSTKLKFIGDEKMKELLDLHVHTISSGHAYSTVKENIDEAKNKGLKFLGISDHSDAMPGGASKLHFLNLRVLKKSINGIRILKGAEVNILDYNGKLDLPDRILKELDYVIASIHMPCIRIGTKEENTNAIIKAMENPYVKIIGHPDDSRIPINYEEVVLAAKRTKTLLEINNSSLKEDGHRKGAKENLDMMLKLCMKHNVMVVLGTDSHVYYEVGDFENCRRVLKDADFPNELVLNYSEDPLEILLSIKN